MKLIQYDMKGNLLSTTPMPAYSLVLDWLAIGWKGIKQIDAHTWTAVGKLTRERCKFILVEDEMTAEQRFDKAFLTRSIVAPLIGRLRDKCK